jgi:hypothetical protein
MDPLHLDLSHCSLILVETKAKVCAHHCTMIVLLGEIPIEIQD